MGSFKYNPIGAEQSEENHDGHVLSPINYIPLRAWICHGTLISISSLLLLLSFVDSRSSSTPDSSYTPENILKRQAVKFNGTFEFPSKFRGPPTPALDEEWDRFTANRWIDGTAAILSASPQDFISAGMTDADWLNSTVQLDLEHGGGYMATFEVFHQLHCLNVLRKATHEDYYKDKGGAFRNGGRTLRDHLDHCVEIIRQVLMCQSDTGLIFYHWVAGNPVPYPDFNTWHQCRNPELVLAWALDNVASINHHIRKTDGIVEMPTAP